MESYDSLAKALRCKRDDCEGCDLAFFDKDEGWMCQFAAKDDDAAAAIEALQAELIRICKQLPKRGQWELIDEAETMRWGCSRCKYLSWETSSYCPRCGAKMEVQG